METACEVTTSRDRAAQSSSFFTMSVHCLVPMIFVFFVLASSLQAQTRAAKPKAIPVPKTAPETLIVANDRTLVRALYEYPESCLPLLVAAERGFFSKRNLEINL